MALFSRPLVQRLIADEQRLAPERFREKLQQLDGTIDHSALDDAIRHFLAEGKLELALMMVHLKSAREKGTGLPDARLHARIVWLSGDRQRALEIAKEGSPYPSLKSLIQQLEECTDEASLEEAWREEWRDREDEGSEPAWRSRTALLLHGDHLQPEEVTAAMGLEPVEAHLKGSITKGARGREYVNKTGFWEYAKEFKYRDGDNAIEDLHHILEKVGPRTIPVSRIPGVDWTRLDIFLGGNRPTGLVISAAVEFDSPELGKAGALGMTIIMTTYPG